MIATSVGYDIVFLIHLLAGVAVLAVFITMHYSAQKVARGADSAVQQAKFPVGRNWAARMLHILPITGIIMSITGSDKVSFSQPWVSAGLLIYILAAGHLEARLLPSERAIAQTISEKGVASPEAGRKFMISVDTLLALVAVGFIVMLTQI
jgi:hypothetical protein